VLDLRGRIVPVYDLAASLSIASEITDESKIVIVDSGAQVIGVIVDSVEEVLTIEHDQIDEAPTADQTLIDGIAKIDGRLIVILIRPSRHCWLAPEPPERSNPGGASSSTKMPIAGRAGLWSA
jgi:chemotaxis signal transduction protein